MKKFQAFYEKGEHKWFCLYKDLARGKHLIGTKEYLIQNGEKVLLTDPGGTEVFPEIVAAIAEISDFEKIDRVFCSHQDPDIFSAIALWLQIKPELKVYVSKIWLGFMLHFAGTKATFELMSDEGAVINLGGLNLQAIPAHFMHSSGNFHLYDPAAKILFSGDTGAAIIPVDQDDLFVRDFDKHLPLIEGFHRRWFGSNEHKNQWCERVSTLEIDMLCPQHGLIYQGADVPRFIDWLHNLKVGVINY
ncbi:MAG: flavoprotein [Candidatus Lambdaproteobacteria bacterium RIFOXYD1_FULL_56_27]|uniref:Flavoprotein n=1 Tax=Candidatus Lambdaproteobacteria bacterium RIFOXYD2_FULL_56_26 TaxID=1817773 RepID=A0A1F6H0M6_9PROT|nr:MAG: flavoprotein [Candidatus Lambdaproteobacteria bacterium RIFOXYC1_FULL_56_13]OGH03840.1 MAG: flavoprotein [Candidatus Lambdaproteobacteria bacterium RIFOXYD2_FULL_56_26]OGH08968.1 MAG: flavoprotein [Candidatus Lambdaproteobacteria bacterium RIFOXYD1_FULL_56_27]